MATFAHVSPDGVVRHVMVAHTADGVPDPVAPADCIEVAAPPPVGETIMDAKTWELRPMTTQEREKYNQPPKLYTKQELDLAVETERLKHVAPAKKTTRDK